MLLGDTGLARRYGARRYVRLVALARTPIEDSISHTGLQRCSRLLRMSQACLAESSDTLVSICLKDGPRMSQANEDDPRMSQANVSRVPFILLRMSQGCLKRLMRNAGFRVSRMSRAKRLFRRQQVRNVGKSKPSSSFSSACVSTATIGYRSHQIGELESRLKID